MLGFGLIGCGAIAAVHARAIAACPSARLIGVADQSPDRAARFAGAHDCRAFDGVEALFASPDVDAVCILTPSGLHAPQAMQAMRAGKHVLIEKPMALTVRQADEVIETALKTGVKAGVVSQHRFSPALIRLKKAAEDGKLGRLVTADVFMKYYREPSYYAQSRWRGTWAMDGGGALMNQGIHGVDTLLYVAGPIACVSGATRTLAHDIEVEDTASALVEFQNGSLGLIQGTTSAYPGYPRRLSVSGTRGTVTVCEQLITEWDIRDEPVPDDIRLGGEQLSGASDPMRLDESGHRFQIADMAQAIETDREPAVPLRDARRVIEVIEGIYHSARTGERIWMEGQKQ